LNTLRARVVTWYVGLLAAALVLFGATLYFGVQSYLRTSLQHSLIGDARAIGSTFLIFEEEKGPAWMSGEISEAYAPESSGRFIRITRQDGNVLYQSGDTRDPIIDASEIKRQQFQQDDAGYFRSEVQKGSHDLLIYTQPFRSSHGTRYLIETGASVAPIESVLSSLLRIVLIITPLILIAAAFGGQMLMKLPLQPLVTLTERAELIGTAKLGERLPVLVTGDEMERLSLSLNRMISRLEDALSLNRRFSADVSHELRTPLTIMRGELEQVQLDPETPPAVRECVDSALEEITRMAKIVESLLAIARLDSGADAIDPLPADVGKLCRWVMEQMHLLAEEKDITMRVDVISMMVPIDTERIKQVLVNLIDNAIKYTPEGGSITLTAFPTERTAIIEVSDTGIGIAADELPHVFDRFFRADKVRSRLSGGTGLGLSIVKAICNAHRGSIIVRSTEGRGTLVRIELPLAAPSSHASTLGTEAEKPPLVEASMS
jgi:heavy metal sensor kinase